MGFTTSHAFPKLRAGASIFLILFATTVRSLAARVDPVRICLRNGCDHSTSDAVVHAIQTALQRRKLSVRYLASHWILHYHELTPFAPSWNVAFSLSYFWVQRAIQLSSMTGEYFRKNSLAMHMRLGAVGDDMGRAAAGGVQKVRSCAERAHAGDCICDDGV